MKDANVATSGSEITLRRAGNVSSRVYCRLHTVPFGLRGRDVPGYLRTPARLALRSLQVTRRLRPVASQTQPCFWRPPQF